MAGGIAGAATAAAPGSALLFSGALGTANSIIGQGFVGDKFSFKNVDLGSAFGAGAMSMVTAYAGGQVGAAMHLDKLLGDISSPLLKNVIGGQIGGITIGGAFGGLSAVANGQDFVQGTWNGAKMGFVSGTIGGIGSAGQFALDNKVNLFTGKPNPVMPSPTPRALPAHQEQQSLPAHTEYPPNDGFQGETKQDYLMPGDVVDRYGEVTPKSDYLAPQGTSIEMRSLSPSTNTNIYNRYMVMKPIPVTSGTIAPWFNQPGMGTQFRTPLPINTLYSKGFIIKF